MESSKLELYIFYNSAEILMVSSFEKRKERGMAISIAVIKIFFFIIISCFLDILMFIIVYQNMDKSSSVLFTAETR